jgi:hypothetical protein
MGNNYFQTLDKVRKGLWFLRQRNSVSSTTSQTFWNRGNFCNMAWCWGLRWCSAKLLNWGDRLWSKVLERQDRFAIGSFDFSWIPICSWFWVRKSCKKGTIIKKLYATQFIEVIRGWKFLPISFPSSLLLSLFPFLLPSQDGLMDSYFMCYSKLPPLFILLHRLTHWPVSVYSSWLLCPFIASLAFFFFGRLSDFPV